MSTNDPTTEPDTITGDAEEIDLPEDGGQEDASDAVSDASVSDDMASEDMASEGMASDDALSEEDVADEAVAEEDTDDVEPALMPAASGDAPSSSITYTEVKIPKAGVAVAVLTLVAAVIGVAYYAIVGPTLNAYSVNGDSVSRDELVLRLEEIAPELVDVAAMPEDAPAEARAQLAQTLSGLIVEDLVTGAAEDAGIEISETDIDAELEAILEEGFGGDQAAFDEAIAASGLPEETIRQQIRTQLLVEELAAASGEGEVSEEDIQAAYDAQFSSGSVSHILVATEEEATAVLERLDAGESFADVAQELSIDTGSGARGGDLGPFQPGAFVPEFEEAVLATDPGEITGPVETQFGFHIITVTEPPALEDVREDIVAALEGQSENEAIQTFVSGIDAEAEVTVDPAYGEWVGLQQGGVIPPQPEPTSLDLELPSEQ